VISCAWKFGVHALECFDVSGLGKRGTRRRQTTDDRRMETIVTKKMRDAGSLFASDCMDARCCKLDGGKAVEQWAREDMPNKDLLIKYINGEIDAVTGIYLAMERAKEEPR